MEKQISFRCTEDERRQIAINAAARGLTQLEYCRLACLLLINETDYPITQTANPSAY